MEKECELWSIRRGEGNYKQKNPRMLKPGDKASCITNNNFLLGHHQGGDFFNVI